MESRGTSPLYEELQKLTIWRSNSIKTGSKGSKKLAKEKLSGCINEIIAGVYVGNSHAAKE